MQPLFLRFLADSNRRTRFCRPLPNHSAKEPFKWDCKSIKKSDFTNFLWNEIISVISPNSNLHGLAF